jgi:plasmid stabilization system protein ParE
MSRRLVLDPEALRDLDGIFDYLVQRNPAAATRYIRELQERCALYADTPFLIGQEEPEIARRWHEVLRSILQLHTQVRGVTARRRRGREHRPAPAILAAHHCCVH